MFLNHNDGTLKGTNPYKCIGNEGHSELLGNESNAESDIKFS